ncbi:MAG TPA: hypothetical protein PL064_00505, partial [Thermogutta sp.]|nr:hypothetical protein [Thermogutta sp.]
GAKAGDTFTRITIGVAAFWIGLCIFTLLYFRWTHRSRLDLGPTGPSVTNTAPLAPTTLPPAPGGEGSGASGGSSGTTPSGGTGQTGSGTQESGS